MLDDQLFQIEDAALREQFGMVNKILLDLVLGRFGLFRGNAVEVGARKNFAACRFDGLDNVGFAVEFLFDGLLLGELLLDQAVEDFVFGLRGRLRRDVAVAGEDVVDLVYGDFLRIDPGGDLGGGFSPAPFLSESSLSPQPATRAAVSATEVILSRVRVSMVLSRRESVNWCGRKRLGSGVRGTDSKLR